MLNQGSHNFKDVFTNIQDIFILKQLLLVSKERDDFFVITDDLQNYLLFVEKIEMKEFQSISIDLFIECYQNEEFI